MDDRGSRLRNGLFGLGFVAGVLLVAGFLGYGNFAASVPGLLLLVVAAYLGVRVGRTLD